MTDVPFEIPESWEWVKLGDECKPIKRGKSPKYIEQSNILIFAQITYFLKIGEARLRGHDKKAGMTLKNRSSPNDEDYAR